MPTVAANGLELYYDDLGDPEGEPVLLIAGLGNQCIFWEDGFCRQLGERGFRVVRFDNRDVGLSTWLDELGVGLGPDEIPPPVYRISDMAADAAALLEAIELSPAHVVGQSMGGFIAQRLAINHPKQVRSLVSISSSTGAPGVGEPTDGALAAMLSPRPPDRAGAIAASAKAGMVWASPSYPRTWEERIARNSLAYDRADNPAGVIRQMGAVIHQEDRTEALGRVAVPALVIHGTADTLVQPSGGSATAAAIPGAHMVTFDGMGHDLPEPLWPHMARAIADNARRSLTH